MKSSGILLVDSIVNFLLGILLLIFPRVIMKFLGLPLIESAFYPSILGAVLIGIAIALFLERRRKNSVLIGLGRGGAIAINLCGALALSAWLMFGNLSVPWRGRIILWSLAALIVIIALVEIRITKKFNSDGNSGP